MTVTPAGKKPWGAGRVAFFLHRDAIQRALDEGHSMAAIHRAHAKALGIGYDQFVNYVAQYLRRPMPGRAAALKPGAPSSITSPSASLASSLSQPSVAAQEREPRRVSPEQPRRFHVDPMGMFKKKLI